MRYALAFFLLLSGLANAQVVSITNYINTQLPNNTSRTITAANVRNANLAVVNNFSSIPYAGQVSTSFPVTASIFYGSGAGLTDITISGSGCLTYNCLTGVPTVLQNISNTVGSVSVTSLFAATERLGTGTLTDAPLTVDTTSDAVGQIGLHLRGQANTSGTAIQFTNPGVSDWSVGVDGITNAMLIQTNRFTGASGTLIAYFNTSGLTVGGVTASGIISTPSLNVTTISASSVYVTGTTGTVSATNGYFKNVSTTSLVVGSGGCTGCAGAATPGGPSGSIQFNLAGTSISGSTNLVTVNNQVGLGIAAPNAKLDVSGIISSTGLNVNGGVTTTTINAVGGLFTTITPTVYSVNTNTTASNTQVLYVSGSNIDGALGLAYFNNPNWVTIGTQTGNSPVTPNDALQITGGITMTGAITGTTLMQAATVSATTGLYAKAISVTNLALLGTVSTTGAVSNTSTYSNVVYEGVQTIAASSSPTTLTLGAASLISTLITANTTVAFSGSVPTTAQVVLWRVSQDATGGRVITWPATARFNGNISPTINTTALTNSLFTLTPMPGTANILVTMPATGVSN